MYRFYRNAGSKGDSPCYPPAACKPIDRYTQLGLRAIATSRYSFGYYGAKLCSVLNVIVVRAIELVDSDRAHSAKGGGYGVVNYVVVGQILSAVADFHISITVGIVIIAILSYLISLFGFRLVHTFEKYSWIYTLIIFFVLYAQTAPHVDSSLPATSSGLVLSGSILTIIAINFCKLLIWTMTVSNV